MYLIFLRFLKSFNSRSNIQIIMIRKLPYPSFLPKNSQIDFFVYQCFIVSLIPHVILIMKSKFRIRESIFVSIFMKILLQNENRFSSFSQILDPLEYKFGTFGFGIKINLKKKLGDAKIELPRYLCYILILFRPIWTYNRLEQTRMVKQRRAKVKLFHFLPCPSMIGGKRGEMIQAWV